jgi:hypothetical protein
MLGDFQRKQKTPVSSSAGAFDSTLTAQAGAEKVSRKAAKARRMHGNASVKILSYLCALVALREACFLLDRFFQWLFVPAGVTRADGNTP